MTQPCDLLIDNIQLASMQNNGQPYGAIKNAMLAVKDGKILYAGEHQPNQFTAEQHLDGQGQWLLPGFVDCHTHLVYGGDRANEFEQRLNGVSYTEIAKQGGGIKSTVKATREASFDQLLQSGLQRAKCLFAEGVTSIEIKSGYGLDKENEIKMLKVAKAIDEHLPVTIQPTFLGAHALPPEYAEDADGYIEFICNDLMPVIAAQQLATAVDVFCESIGFSPAQCERVFKAAQQQGLAIKAHVEQLSDLKGAALAASYQALSVDHIEYLADNDIATIKAAGTVAVLLPGAFYYLKETQKPPIDALRAHQVPMAVATDLNPGSSPVASLLTCLNMACTFFGLTPEEALRGATQHAATALGLTHKGVIEAGMDADFCLWDIQRPAELVYAMNQHKPQSTWVGGQHVSQ